MGVAGRTGEIMYRLRVKRHFDAAHFLPGHKGQCANIHGHRWEVEVRVDAQNVGDGGMVMDFADVKFALDNIINRFDHKNLNDMPEFSVAQPTAENVAVVFLHKMNSQIGSVTSVRVWESPNASVEVTHD